MKGARCSSKDRSLSQASVTSSETNALRYAAGYVPFALKKKLKHRPEFVTHLEQLEVKGEGDSYLAYTTEWIDSINRGKLFRINDEAYYIVEDTDVHFSWLMLCLELDDKELSKELLGLVVDMWITIRGFSMAGAWVEYYKHSMQMCTKKKQGLRKGLKRKQMTQSVDNVD